VSMLSACRPQHSVVVACLVYDIVYVSVVHFSVVREHMLRCLRHVITFVLLRASP